MSVLALTARAAKRWKVPHVSLPAVEAGAWVVDLMKLGKGPLLVLIVHQETLFTLLRPASVVKTLAQVAAEVAAVQQGRAPAISPLCKNGNRGVTGSINEMKFMIGYRGQVDDLLEVEDGINGCLFSAIGMDYPRERFARFRDGLA